MNAVDLTYATAAIVADPGTAHAVNYVGDLLAKIERQRRHLTQLERSRMSQRKQIRNLRSALANMLAEFAPRQAAGHAQIQGLLAHPYPVTAKLGDTVVTSGDSYQLANAFDALGIACPMTKELFERRTAEIARG